MLKYEVKQNDITNKKVKLNILNSYIESILENNEKENLICTVDNIEPLKKIKTLFCSNSIDIFNETERDVANFYSNLNIKSIDLTSNKITLEVNKYYGIELDELEVSLDNNIEYWYFKFNGYHLFNEDDDVITLYIKFYDRLTNKWLKISIDCEYVDYYTLKWKFDKNITNIISLADNIFLNDYYEEINYIPNIEWVHGENWLNELPYNISYLSPMYIRLNGEEEKYFIKKYGKESIENINIERENILYDTGNFDLYYFINECIINIPISQTYDTQLYSSDVLNEQFTINEKEKSINEITEMEKNVYHPVFPEFNENGDIINFHDINEIHFNLHFRKHEGENWVVKDDEFWNGVNNASENDISLMNPTSSYVKPFFSYSNIDNQSDLLSYLGFTDSDVRYQKSNIKKSFLRLSCYDSNNQTNQNLLNYSTVFLDSGKLFGRMNNNVNTTNYVISGKDGMGGYVGARTNREPGRFLTFGRTDDEIEKLRVSSQLVVKNRYNSDASSDGFYLYLWADNDLKNIPVDIFMKIDFNNAEYGRTSSFMLPFFDKDLDGKSGVKGFNDILNDWKYGGYGIKRFLKYNYINFKYSYDKFNKRYVYYLDPEKYGDYAKYEEGKKILNINLYEAKVTFSDDDDIDNKFPIKTEYNNLKITSFKWECNNITDPGTDKKVENTLCGGHCKAVLKYEYDKKSLFKSFNEGYLYYPTNDTGGVYKYVIFNDIINSYVLLNNPSKPNLSSLNSNSDPTEGGIINSSTYVRYNKQLYKWYGTFYGIYTDNDIIQEPIETKETSGATVKYSIKSGDSNYFDINENTGVVVAHRTNVDHDVKILVTATVKLETNQSFSSDTGFVFGRILTESVPDGEELEYTILTCKPPIEPKYLVIESDFIEYDVYSVNEDGSQSAEPILTISNEINLDLCDDVIEGIEEPICYIPYELFQEEIVSTDNINKVKIKGKKFDGSHGTIDYDSVNKYGDFIWPQTSEDIDFMNIPKGIGENEDRPIEIIFPRKYKTNKFKLKEGNEYINETGIIDLYNNETDAFLETNICKFLKSKKNITDTEIIINNVSLNNIIYDDYDNNWITYTQFNDSIKVIINTNDKPLERSAIIVFGDKNNIIKRKIVQNGTGQCRVKFLPCNFEYENNIEVNGSPIDFNVIYPYQLNTVISVLCNDEFNFCCWNDTYDDLEQHNLRDITISDDMIITPIIFNGGNNPNAVNLSLNYIDIYSFDETNSISHNNFYNYDLNKKIKIACISKETIIENDEIVSISYNKTVITDNNYSDFHDYIHYNINKHVIGENNIIFSIYPIIDNTIEYELGNYSFDYWSDMSKGDDVMIGVFTANDDSSLLDNKEFYYYGYYYYKNDGLYKISRLNTTNNTFEPIPSLDVNDKNISCINDNSLPELNADSPEYVRYKGILHKKTPNGYVRCLDVAIEGMYNVNIIDYPKNIVCILDEDVRNDSQIGDYRIMRLYKFDYINEKYVVDNSFNEINFYEWGENNTIDYKYKITESEINYYKRGVNEHGEIIYEIIYKISDINSNDEIPILNVEYIKNNKRVNNGETYTMTFTDVSPVLDNNNN